MIVDKFGNTVQDGDYVETQYRLLCRVRERYFTPLVWDGINLLEKDEDSKFVTNIDIERATKLTEQEVMFRILKG